MNDGASDRGAALLPQRLNRAALALTALLALFVAAWLLTPRPSTARVVWTVLLAAPLLVGFRGLWRDDRRTYAWMTLAVPPYLALAVMEAIANAPARAFAVTAGFAAFALFIVLLARLRLLR